MKKKLIPRLCLMLAVMLSLCSCRNDLLPENNTLQNPNASRFRMVKLKDIPNIEQFIHQQSERADLQVPLSEASLTGKDLTVGVIEISTIVETVNEGETYYVFKIENLNSGDAVYNLEVKQADGIPVTAEIIEYDPQDGTTVDFQHFTGSISSYGLDGKAISTVNYNDGLGNCSPATGVPGGNNTSEGGGINPIDLPPPNGGWYNWEEGGSNNNTVPFSNVPGDCTDIILDSHGNTQGWYDHCNNNYYPNPNVHKTTTTGEIPNLSPDCNGEGAGVIITDPETPCEKTKSMITNPVVKAKIDEMKDQSKLAYSDPNYGETGYKFDANGVPTPKIPGGKHDVDLGDTAGYSGAYHNHTVLGTNMLSPADIIKLLDFSLAQTNGNIEDGYLGVIGSEVCSSCPGGYKYYHYIINFSGNMSELTQYVYNNTWNLEQLKKDFKKRDGILADNPLYVDNLGDELNSQGLEKLFFDTLKNMGLDGKINLQRIENNGTVKTVTLNSDDNTTTATPCPN
ncbi:hypothetical protein N0B16_00290 [Chryseobacterium sp. GMJ5]|uniref:YHYH domain-containing protein n=1 Tax=Chryseobacterium gilvum TaxID=2976534 RepID=A0ABT2VSY7_9FLAO|nr:hypothetical protein [Chryseobacterium gilvum]MCU7612870.1 hypothetical protein [Chryseobacterium gilvum]